jgi:hypothetical protein
MRFHCWIEGTDFHEHLDAESAIAAAENAALFNVSSLGTDLDRQVHVKGMRGSPEKSFHDIFTVIFHVTATATRTT